MLSACIVRQWEQLLCDNLNQRTKNGTIDPYWPEKGTPFLITPNRRETVMTPRFLLLSIALLLAGAAPIPSPAEESPPVYDRIDLSIDLTREVPNDVLVAVLYIQREGTDTPKLADEVNQAMGRAVTKAKQVKGIQVQTLDYSTSPIYWKGKLTRWRVRQSLRLVARDATLLSQLIGELQDRLSVQSIGYQTSQAARRKAEEELIIKAVKAFTRRAEAVTHALGRSRYRLVRMDINKAGGPVTRMAVQAAGLKMQAAPPALESGTQTLRTHISGTIELQTQ